MHCPALVLSLMTAAVSAFGQEPVKTEAPADSVAASAAAAAVKLRSGLRTWFMNLKEGLSESSVAGQRQQRRLTSVAAVRGTSQDGAAGRSVVGASRGGATDAERPVWKSGAQSKKMKQLRLEKAEFSAAVDLILEGKFKEAGEKLDAFETSYPGSSLLPELRDTRAKLKEAEAAAVAEAEPAKP